MKYAPNMDVPFDRLVVFLTLSFLTLLLGAPIVWMAIFGLTVLEAIIIMLGTVSTWMIGSVLIFFIVTKVWK